MKTATFVVLLIGTLAIQIVWGLMIHRTRRDDVLTVYRHDTIADVCFARVCFDDDCNVLALPTDACHRVNARSIELNLWGPPDAVGPGPKTR